MNPFSWLKNRLSHINSNDWHFQAVEFIWNDKARGKACTYYWFKLPVSLIVFAVLCVLMVVICTIVPFFGFIPTFFPTKNEAMLRESNEHTYPYKRLPNGWKMPVAPWELAAAAGALAGIYYLAFIDQGLGAILGLIVLALAVFVAIIYGISRSWSNPLIAGARANVKAAWDKTCPELEVTYKRNR